MQYARYLSNVKMTKKKTQKFKPLIKYLSDIPLKRNFNINIT